MASKGPAVQPKALDVVREDQQKINAYSRLHAKSQEVEAALKQQKTLLEELEDASNELMLSDEDNVRFTIGECLVHYDKDTAEERLTAFTEKTQKEVAAKEAELEEIKDKLKELKVVLYAKFGNSINLDDDSQ